MELSRYWNRYNSPPEKCLFDVSTFSLQSLFPLPNNGCIQPNSYYHKDEVHRYLYTQCQIVMNALSSSFDSGVYFLWDSRRKLLKIGCSRNIQKRIQQLINNAKTYAMNDDLFLIGIHPTSPDLTLKLEKYYHVLFQKYAYKYEWFSLSLEQYEETMRASQQAFSTFVSTLFLDFWIYYSTVDLLLPELDTILDIWPFSKNQIYELLHYDELNKHELTLLVQDHRGNIIPFGWKQDDIQYLNETNIWENPHLVCFQKLRVLTLNDTRRQENFADSLILG